MQVFKEILSNWMGRLGLFILLSLTVLSFLVIIISPGDIVAKWNSPEYWLYNPRLAMPSWVNYLGFNLPETKIIKLQKHISQSSGPIYVGEVFWDYSSTPSEVVIEIESGSDNALVMLSLRRPDGLEIRLIEKVVSQRGVFRFNIDLDEEIRRAVQSALGSGEPSRIIFLDNKGNILKGSYRFLGNIYNFGQGEVYVRVILYGRVYGTAGTDDMRRDIFLGMMYGIPIAFLFGVATAFSTTFIQAFFGIIAGWFGRRIDIVIDRLADIFLLLPFIPVLITIAVFIGKFTLVMLFYVVVLLSMFGSITKATRSYVLQLKNSAYIEAARIAGAGNFWIITRHIMPAVLPFIFANAVISVPTYIYLEAALSLIGFGDPFLPTLGKIIERAFSEGALYKGYWWWLLSPTSVLILMTLGFAMLGYALDQIVNPRLKRR